MTDAPVPPAPAVPSATPTTPAPSEPPAPPVLPAPVASALSVAPPASVTPAATATPTGTLPIAVPSVASPTPPVQIQFTMLSRVLHWTMAAMILTMLFIGAAMVASLGNYHALVSLHRPLGIAVLLLAMVRFVNRQLNPPPPFPESMSSKERLAASASERLMYGLMFALPLVGWGMLSAAGYPIVMVGALHLPPILPQSPELYATLRKMHTLLAYLFFLTFTAHFAAILFHTLIVRDGILKRMAPWNTRPS